MEKGSVIWEVTLNVTEETLEAGVPPVALSFFSPHLSKTIFADSQVESGCNHDSTKLVDALPREASKELPLHRFPSSRKIEKEEPRKNTGKRQSTISPATLLPACHVSLRREIDDSFGNQLTLRRKNKKPPIDSLA